MRRAICSSSGAIQTIVLTLFKSPWQPLLNALDSICTTSVMSAPNWTKPIL